MEILRISPRYSLVITAIYNKCMKQRKSKQMMLDLIANHLQGKVIQIQSREDMLKFIQIVLQNNSIQCPPDQVKYQTMNIIHIKSKYIKQIILKLNLNLHH